jgi:deoxyribodipyrimidine photolyase
MDEATQERCGCRIGRDYPEPIVDHAEARREALDRYRV